MGSPAFFMYIQGVKNATVAQIARQTPNDIIAKAYAFSEAAHRKQKRQNGEPYFTHPLATAELLNAWHLDKATIAAGLLHDTVEDTGVPLETIKKEFGEEIAFLVDGVTKLGHIKYRGAEKKAENLRKLILALSQDLRVIFIKLADRLHNMQTLAAVPPAKQRRIALETDEIYAPIAYRLGMHNLSGELQDLAFPYLHPQEYRWLLNTAKEQYEKRLAYLETITPDIKKILKTHDINPIEVEVRAKRYSSLYKKLLRHEMDMGRIYDLAAVRIILNTVPECYAALGVIHETWPPLPGRIKDYIAMPKPNAYRSLHTTVLGPEGKAIEFQIRTKAMHDENEFGIAAHWIYKASRGDASTGKKLAKDLPWVQQLREWQERYTKEAENSQEFIDLMKIDFFKDRIFAVTPHGDVIDLPAGATPIDFAYHVHSEIGNSCAGAKVNGAIVPLDHALQSGDVVEIIAQKGKKPSEDWLRFVKTSIARDHIKASARAKKNFAKDIALPAHCELKIVVDDRVGLIKDISACIARNHMNIMSFHAENPKGGRFPFDKVEVQSTDKIKIEKLILKLKDIKGVKEVSYRLI